MAVNKKLLNLTGAVLAAVIIGVCSVIIFNTTNDRTVNPQTFSGEATIVSLEPDNSQWWAKACKVVVRDEKKQELTVNARRDVCGTSTPGDVLTMDAGQVVLGQASIESKP